MRNRILISALVGLILLTAGISNALADPVGPVATYTADNQVLGWWYFDGAAWNSLPLGANYSNWRLADSYTLPGLASGQYQIIWQLGNFGVPNAGNPGGFLAQVTVPGAGTFLSSSAWQVSFLKDNQTVPDLNSLQWVSSTEVGSNSDPTTLWYRVNLNNYGNGPVLSISDDAQWIWTAANFASPDAPDFDDSVFIKASFDPPTNPTDSVPEPATILLIGSGLLGIVGFRKKFKKYNNK